jgi:GNAT superfamily N-acetyltransferase
VTDDGPASIDELMANAWPPAVQRREGTWRFRWTSGITLRANSALAVGCGDRMAELVEIGEDFYLSRGMPPCFQVGSASAPPALAGFLRGRGYAARRRALVMCAGVDAALGRLGAGSWDVRLTPTPTDAWFETFWSVESALGHQNPAARITRQILLAPTISTTFAAVEEGGEVIAVAQLVLERGWAGLQCLATAPAHRNRGAGAAALHHLVAEARRAGARNTWLAVLEDNTTALRLHARAGFVAVHDYSYLSRP